MECESKALITPMICAFPTKRFDWYRNTSKMRLARHYAIDGAFSAPNSKYPHDNHGDSGYIRVDSVMANDSRAANGGSHRLERRVREPAIIQIMPSMIWSVY